MKIGPYSGTTFANDTSVGSVAWSNPGNAAADDLSYATAMMAFGAQSNYLKVTGFSFNLPTNIQLDGIVVEVKQKANLLSALNAASVKVTVGGQVVGADQSGGIVIPLVEQYIPYGASTDMWGNKFKPEDVNRSDFGVLFSASAAVLAQANINHIRVSVYWSELEGLPNTSENFKAGGGEVTSGIN